MKAVLVYAQAHTLSTERNLKLVFKKKFQLGRSCIRQCIWKIFNFCIAWSLKKTGPKTEMQRARFSTENLRVHVTNSNLHGTRQCMSSHIQVLSKPSQEPLPTQRKHAREQLAPQNTIVGWNPDWWFLLWFKTSSFGVWRSHLEHIVLISDFNAKIQTQVRAKIPTWKWGKKNKQQQ